MKKSFLILLGCLLSLSLLAVPQVFAVDVYGEGAYDDTTGTVQVNLYANIDGAEALRSFGVRLIYDPNELEFNATDSKTNQDTWYLGEGPGGINHSYRGPESIEVSESSRAAIMIGGKLDVNDTGAKVAGTRVLLGKIFFNRLTGTGQLAGDLTVDLGREAPFANFVIGPNPDDVLDTAGSAVSFLTVSLYERGDANADGTINTGDYIAIRNQMHSTDFSPWVDCNGDGAINTGDYICVRNKR